MEINERIFYLLKMQNRTAKELSEFIGIAQSSVSAWKNENSFPSSKYMVQISEFFSISINYLLTGENDNIELYSKSELTKDETELIHTYKQLDRRGQYRIHTVIYEEIDRLQLTKNLSNKKGNTG